MRDVFETERGTGGNDLFVWADQPSEWAFRGLQRGVAQGFYVVRAPAESGCRSSSERRGQRYGDDVATFKCGDVVAGVRFAIIDEPRTACIADEKHRRFQSGQAEGFEGGFVAGVQDSDCWCWTALSFLGSTSLLWFYRAADSVVILLSGIQTVKFEHFSIDLLIP